MLITIFEKYLFPFYLFLLFIFLFFKDMYQAHRFEGDPWHILTDGGARHVEIRRRCHWLGMNKVGYPLRCQESSKKLSWVEVVPVLVDIRAPPARTECVKRRIVPRVRTELAQFVHLKRENKPLFFIQKLKKSLFLW